MSSSDDVICVVICWFVLEVDSGGALVRIHHDQERNYGRVRVYFFILLFKFCTWTAWGSLISKGHLPYSGSTGGLWIEQTGKSNSFPFRTSLFFSMFSLIGFCSQDSTPDDRWPPGATTSNSCSSSSSSSTNLIISYSFSSLGLCHFWYFLFSGFDLRDFFSGVSTCATINSPIT